VRCPVCQAAFRGAAQCSRCGADLQALMEVAARAWRLRQSAREALLAGDFHAAERLAGWAQELQATSAGRSLQAVAAALA
jgi:hypothetical protein